MSAITNDGKKSKRQLMVEVFMAKMRSDMQSIPTAPCIPSLEKRKLRASLMLEECLETIREGLGLGVFVKGTEDEIKEVEFVEDCSKQPNLIQIADGLMDQGVVNDGTGSTCGIALEPLELIVSANNLMKFAPGHSFNGMGKLIKPPNHPTPYEAIYYELLAQGADGEKLAEDLKRCS